MPPLNRDALLRRCGPLADPMRATTRFLLACAWGQVLLYSIPLSLLAWKTLGQGSPSASASLVLAPLMMMILGMSLPVGIWMLLWESERGQVIYLRAFRSDIASRRIRTLINAALGNRYRLCGIRPPIKRVWWLSRLFLTQATGLRYLGSESFELEAGDYNWMARLLASYDETHFVFIDVRDITDHVADEIRLTYLALGASYCVFIVDSNRNTQEWLTFLADVLEEPAATLANLRLLFYPGDGAYADFFVSDTTKLVHELSSYPPPTMICDEALAFARERVSASCWVTPWRDTDTGQIVYSVIFTTIVFSILEFSFALTDEAALVSALGLNVLLILLFFPAWFRARRQAAIQSSYREITGAGGQGFRLWCALFLACIGFVLLLVAALGSFALPRL